MYHPCMKLTKDLVAASAVPLILAILEEGENYGYALIQRTRELSGGAIEWTDGMLYPARSLAPPAGAARGRACRRSDRKSTRLNSSHEWISYAVFCLKKKKTTTTRH